ncbi:Uncharacterised protein [Burkholderia pseudomallei]|nr:Uncharacterised protein [Burkholderia pseudomallei]
MNVNLDGLERLVGDLGKMMGALLERMGAYDPRRAGLAGRGRHARRCADAADNAGTASNAGNADNADNADNAAGGRAVHG